MLIKPRRGVWRGGGGGGSEVKRKKEKRKKEEKKKEKKRKQQHQQQTGKKFEAGKSHSDPVPASVYDSRLSKTIAKKMKLKEPESKK